MKITANPNNLLKLFKIDSSLLFLIISNILTIFFAIKGSWNLITIMWIFWSQSVIIGIFNFLKILNLQEFKTDNFYINDRPVKPTKYTKKFTAFFFAVHYGIFHLAYMIFLLSSSGELNGIPVNYDNSVPGKEIIWIMITALIFFSNHLFSYLKNKENDSKKVRNIGTIMFFPYARILPMHIAICFGLFLMNNSRGILLFLTLKTLADVIMHQVEHYT